jgi:hypothetical protein
MRGSAQAWLMEVAKGGFELGGAAHGKLGAGHAVEGFDLLSVDGLVAVEEVGAQFLELGGTSTRTTMKREAARPFLDGVLRRGGFAFLGAGTGTSLGRWRD